MAEEWWVERHRKEIEEVAHWLYKRYGNPDANHNWLRAIAMVEESYDIQSPFNRKWMT